MFRDMGDRFPEMKPVRAIASRDPLAFDWVRRFGLSWSVKQIDYDAVGVDGRRYRDLVERILRSGASVPARERQDLAASASDPDVENSSPL